VAVLLLAVVTAGCAASTPAAPPPAPATAPHTTVLPPPVLSPKPTVDLATWMKQADDALGRLPQTQATPATAATAFRQRIDLLWQAVVTGRPAPALGAFFPLTAYRQVKAISDPDHDWQTRLVALFDADIGAVHDSLGPDPKLVGADVPAGAQWVPPGAEYNKGSYWRVYGTRVRYTSQGRQRSFGVCSMISWRGQWFVVHLGPIVRSGTAGALCPPVG
jgi:hypothetical protein